MNKPNYLRPIYNKITFQDNGVLRVNVFKRIHPKKNKQHSSRSKLNKLKKLKYNMNKWLCPNTTPKFKSKYSVVALDSSGRIPTDLFPSYRGIDINGV